MSVSNMSLVRTLEVCILHILKRNCDNIVRRQMSASRRCCSDSEIRNSTGHLSETRKSVNDLWLKRRVGPSASTEHSPIRIVVNSSASSGRSAKTMVPATALNNVRSSSFASLKYVVRTPQYKLYNSPR